MKHYIQTQHVGLLHKSVGLAKPDVLGCHTQRVKFFTDELFKFIYKLQILVSYEHLIIAFD